MGLLQIDIALARRDYELRLALNLGEETLALVGPSGAGKTSLLRAVAGLERPRAGRISLDDEVWFAESEVDLPPEHRRVGYLPQDLALFPHLDVAGNVRFAAGRDRPELLAKLGVAHLARAAPRDLSGGERQRVALARALAREPALLLLDEPFAALDTVTRREVRSQLAELLSELALPTLVVTHSFEDAAHLSALVGVLDRGKLVQLGSVGELVRKPATATVAALTGANVLSGSAHPLDEGASIALAGGGEVISRQSAQGSVMLAIAPWELAICEPGESRLTDTVLGITEEQDRLVVKLSRFTVFAPHHPRPALAAGVVVGLRAAPEAVRLVSE